MTARHRLLAANVGCRHALGLTRPRYNPPMTTPALPIPPPSADDVLAWEVEFAAAARRPLEQRMKYAFIRTYKPVLEDAPFRSFTTMREYREWCQAHLPDWLGYGRR